MDLECPTAKFAALVTWYVQRVTVLSVVADDRRWLTLRRISLTGTVVLCCTNTGDCHTELVTNPVALLHRASAGWHLTNCVSPRPYLRSYQSRATFHRPGLTGKYYVARPLGTWRKQEQVFYGLIVQWRSNSLNWRNQKKHAARTSETCVCPSWGRTRSYAEHLAVSESISRDKPKLPNDCLYFEPAQSNSKLSCVMWKCSYARHNMTWKVDHFQTLSLLIKSTWQLVVSTWADPQREYNSSRVISVASTANIRRHETYVFGSAAGSGRPFADRALCVIPRDAISPRIGWISVKLATNNHNNMSGHCWRGFKVRGQK